MEKLDKIISDKVHLKSRRYFVSRVIICIFVFLYNLLFALKINEVLYDPIGSDTGNEWIEIYNSGNTEANLLGWKIYSGGDFELDYTFGDLLLKPNSYLLIGGANVKNCDINFDFSFQNGGSSTDGIKLESPDGLYCDVLLYDTPNSDNLLIEDRTIGCLFAPDVSSGKSLARVKDGVDSDNSQNDFYECSVLTPGLSNVKDYSGQIIFISEVLYDPLGSDYSHEWIELYNPTEDTISLQGWGIYSGGDFKLDYTFGDVQITPKDFLVIGGSSLDFVDFENNFSFQNGGTATDGIKIENPDKSFCDVLLYDTPNVNELLIEDGSVGNSFASNISGKSLARVNLEIDLNDSEEDFYSTGFLTPGQANIFSKDMSIDTFYYQKHKLYTEISNLSTFDLELDIATLTLYKGQDIIQVDTFENLLVNSKIEMEFFLDISEDSIVTYKAVLACSCDDVLDNNVVEISVIYGESPLHINEMMIAPGETDCEWIEIYNSSSDEIDLKGFKIRDESLDEGNISGLIASKGYLVVCSDSDKFTSTYPQITTSEFVTAVDLVSLNNSQEKIWLMDSLNTNFDYVSYGNIDCPKGVSIEKFGYKDLSNYWGFCLSKATPNEPNSVKVYKYSNKFEVSLDKNVLARGDTLCIQYVVPCLRTTPILHCNIFDLSGKLKRKLSNYQTRALSGNLYFHGRDDAGNYLKTGVYLIDIVASYEDLLFKRKKYITLK